MPWDSGAGEQAADLSLRDEQGRPVQLSSLAASGRLLALVFGDPYDRAGVKLLCDYRDQALALRKAGAAICGIARADPSALAFLRHERGLGFPLLADPDGTQLPRWGIGGETAVLLLDQDLSVRQRAPGARSPAEAMVRFLQRAGPPRAGWRDRLAHALHALSHVLEPRPAAR